MSNPSRKPRVAVVFGGRSSEHAVSCATAAGVLRAIDREAYDVVPIGITREGAWVLRARLPEAGALLCHNQPPLFLDAARGLCGPVQAPGLTPAQLQLLLKAPPLSSARQHIGCPGSVRSGAFPFSRGGSWTNWWK